MNAAIRTKWCLSITISPYGWGFMFPLSVGRKFLSKMYHLDWVVFVWHLTWSTHLLVMCACSTITVGQYLCLLCLLTAKYHQTEGSSMWLRQHLAHPSPGPTKQEATICGFCTIMTTCTICDLMSCVECGECPPVCDADHIQHLSDSLDVMLTISLTAWMLCLSLVVQPPLDSLRQHKNFWDTLYLLRSSPGLFCTLMVQSLCYLATRSAATDNSQF